QLQVRLQLLQFGLQLLQLRQAILDLLHQLLRDAHLGRNVLDDLERVCLITAGQEEQAYCAPEQKLPHRLSSRTRAAWKARSAVSTSSPASCIACSKRRTVEARPDRMVICSSIPCSGRWAISLSLPWHSRNSPEPLCSWRSA